MRRGSRSITGPRLTISSAMSNICIALRTRSAVRTVVLEADCLPVAPQPRVKPRHLPVPLVNPKLGSVHVLAIELKLPRLRVSDVVPLGMVDDVDALLRPN